MKNKKQRFLWFFTGILINAFGIAMITKADLGTSPISGPAFVLSLKFPLSMGAFTFLLNSFFIVLQLLILRRDFPPMQFLQIVVNIVFSLFIDFSMDVVGRFQPETLPFQLLLLTAGCAVLGFGICVEVAPRVLMAPGEGVVQAISVKYDKDFGKTKIFFDSALLLTALILTFVFFGTVKGLGVGTIISAFLTGRFVNFFEYNAPIITKIEDLRRR